MDAACFFNGALGRHQRLADDLAAEHALPAGLRARAAEEIYLKTLEIERLEQCIEPAPHLVCSRFLLCPKS